MFELSIAKKYLIPKKKQVSNTLIAVMSITVISLVVWLVLLFLSITEGMERNWVQKLTHLNAPLRITPTEAYYSSYYYQIDSLSLQSNFTYKTIAEKIASKVSDAYSNEEDSEIPSSWPKPDKTKEGQLKDPVKKAYTILHQLQKKRKDIAFQDFELSGALLRLQLGKQKHENPSFLTQVSYLSSFSDQSPYLHSLILPPTPKDIDHLSHLSQRDFSLERALHTHVQNSHISTHFEENPIPSPPWVYRVKDKMFLPSDREQRHAILLAKNFQDSGVLLGDSGYLAYQAASMASVQEQRIPIYVAGFYDPGILSVGNKCLLVPSFITQTINASSNSYAFDKTLSNGILVWFENLNHTDQIKAEIAKKFKEAEIDTYWKITTFKEYDFAKDLLQQFQSDKYLFTLIAFIILLVACCNIISLLVLLVNDKKREIGILQAMGASSKSIMLIFGTCGFTMGLVSSLLGIGAALLTLHHIDHIVTFLSFLQGHDAFNVAFYGHALPNQLSRSALVFVLITTPLLALTAGLVPAIKACRLKPSAILRSE